LARDGEFTFVRWIMHATGRLGPRRDRACPQQRDGQVAENVIVFDTNTFDRRSGIAVPWC
jgi:hypothetical protein